MTVLIAAYNAADFLHRAVESALRQSVPVLEVLIVDDASTDRTLAVARELAQSDGRIRVLALRENGGPSAARNAGLDAASGEWVAVLDADDAYLPERVEQMLAFALEAGADIVADNFRYFHPEADRVGPPVLDESGGNSVIRFPEFLLRARPYAGEADWGLLKPIFRRAFLEQHELRYPLSSRHGEDFLFLVEAFLRGAQYALVRKAGYLYTDRSSQLSRTIPDYRLMYQHTRALLHDPRVTSDSMLVQRIQARAVAVRRLSTEADFTRFRAEHDYLSMAKRLFSDNVFRTFIAKRLVRKLLNVPPRRQHSSV